MCDLCALQNNPAVLVKITGSLMNSNSFSTVLDNSFQALDVTPLEATCALLIMS